METSIKGVYAVKYQNPITVYAKIYGKYASKMHSSNDLSDFAVHLMGPFDFSKLKNERARSPMQETKSPKVVMHPFNC
jgi:hypothetical protein